MTWDCFLVERKIVSIASREFSFSLYSMGNIDNDNQPPNYIPRLTIKVFTMLSNREKEKLRIRQFTVNCRLTPLTITPNKASPKSIRKSKGIWTSRKKIKISRYKYQIGKLRIKLCSWRLPYRLKDKKNNQQRFVRKKICEDFTLDFKSPLPSEI